MPLLIPILLGSALLGGGGFITGAATSDKLGSALQVAGLVIGLFLSLLLLQRFGLLKG